MKRYGFIGLAMLLGSGCAHVAHQSEQHDQPSLHAQQRAIHTQPEPQATTHVGDVSRKRGDVEIVLLKSRKKITRAYHVALKRKPNLEGRILVKVKIAPNGDVLDASVRFSSIDDDQLKATLIRIIKDAEFGEGDYDVWHDVYTFNFKAK